MAVGVDLLVLRPLTISESLPPTKRRLSFSVRWSMSFSALRKICSLPVLSSKRNSLAFCAEPPLLLRVTRPGAGAHIRQLVLRDIDAVVHRARYHRVVRVAIEKLDDNFVLQAGPEEGAPSATCPGLGNADPGVIDRVRLALAGPRKTAHTRAPACR